MSVWHKSLPIQINWTYAISPDRATEAHIYCPGNVHPWRMATVNGPDGEATEAYARLIASAPAMHAALEELVKLYAAYLETSGNQADAYYTMIKGKVAVWAAAKDALALSHPLEEKS